MKAERARLLSTESGGLATGGGGGGGGSDGGCGGVMDFLSDRKDSKVRLEIRIVE